jgi:hypothetical protein
MSNEDCRKQTSPSLYRLYLQVPRGGGCTSTVALGGVGSDGKGTQCLGVLLGHLVPGGYKYEDLALQVGGVSNLRQ